MRFSFVLLSTVLSAVLLVAGAPANDFELIARGPTGKTPTKPSAKPQAKPPAAGSAAKLRKSPTTPKGAPATKSKPKSCPVKKKVKSLGKRATIVIGFTGTDSEIAEKYKVSATRTENHAARLGTGLYLTDNLKLAEIFADKAKRADRTKTKKAVVCKISVDEATWIGLSKIWIPNTNGMIDLNPTSGAEDKRKAYETEKCVESPSVRFSTYTSDRAPPNSHELVIPPNLQNGFTAECLDVPQSTKIDSDDEAPMFPKLAFTYKDKVSAWNIAGEVA